MVLKMGGSFVAIGEPEELARFHVLSVLLMNEITKKHKADQEKLEQLVERTWEQLVNSELGKEDGPCHGGSGQSSPSSS